MLAVNSTLIRRVAVGTAWKTATMAGWMGVVYRTEEAKSMGSSTVPAGSTLIAWQPRTGDPKFYWLYPENSQAGVYSNGFTIKGVDGLPSSWTTYPTGLSSAAQASAGSLSDGQWAYVNVPISGELMGHLFDGNWDSGTIDEFEAARTGTSNEW